MSTDRTRQSVPFPADGERFVERRERKRSRLPTLTILCHPDGRRVGERAVLTDVVAGGEAHLSRLSPSFSQPSGGAGRGLDDPYLSRTPLRINAGSQAGTLALHAESDRLEISIAGRPFPGRQEIDVRRLRSGLVIELSRRVVLLLHSMAAKPYVAEESYGLVGASEAIGRVQQEIRRVADLDVPLLIRGETGTGKELVAQAIHRASRRRDTEFLSVNMGAIPPSLAASELFGSVKGSFTGSVRGQIGYFQRAQGGTLFLDEIGEAPPEVQVLLLRALETGEVQRVGSQEIQKVEVRLIAATDIDLESAIAEGKFKEPLLHRLSGYEILVPPLRARRDDFGRLLYYFLRQELSEVGEASRLEVSDPAEPPWLPASIVARLARHPWPGNVRQLRNVARQLVIASRGADAVRVSPQVERVLQEAAKRPTTQVTRVAELSPAEAAGASAELADPATVRRRPAKSYRKPSEVNEEELLAVLRSHRWEIKPAAEELGVSRASLYVLIDKCPRVRKASDLTRAEILEVKERVDGDVRRMVDELEVSQSGLVQRMGQLGID